MTRRFDLSAFRAVDDTSPPSGPPALAKTRDDLESPVVATVPSAPPSGAGEERPKKLRTPPLPFMPADRAGKVGPLLPPELAARLRSLGNEGYVISSILALALDESGDAWLAGQREQSGPRRRSDVGRVQVTLYLPGPARRRLRELAEAAGTSQSAVATGVLRLALQTLEHRPGA